MGKAVFLDVRSDPEVESMQLKLANHFEVLHVPADEPPDRINEIPRDKTIGIFVQREPDPPSCTHISAPRDTRMDVLYPGVAKPSRTCCYLYGY